jgi:hypothetical protein
MRAGPTRSRTLTWVDTVQCATASPSRTGARSVAGNLSNTARTLPPTAFAARTEPVGPLRHSTAEKSQVKLQLAPSWHGISTALAMRSLCGLAPPRHWKGGADEFAEGTMGRTETADRPGVIRAFVARAMSMGKPRAQAPRKVRRYSCASSRSQLRPGRTPGAACFWVQRQRWRPRWRLHMYSARVCS